MAPSSREMNAIRIWLEGRPLATAVLLGFFVWVILILLAHMLWVLVLILVAVILATVLTPVVRFMRRFRVPVLGWRIPKWLAVLIIYLSIFAILADVGYQVTLVLIAEVSQLMTSIPEALRGFLEGLPELERSMGLSGVIPLEQAFLTQVESLVFGMISSPGQLVNFVGGIGWFFFGLFFVLVLALFLVEESDALLGFWISLFPPSQRDQVWATTVQVGDRVGYWLLGQLTVAILSGVVAGFGVWALGLPYPFLFGAGTALLDLAPMLGPSVMGIPAGLLGLSRSPLIAALAVLLFYGLSFLDGHLFSPLITGRFVRLRMSLVLMVVPLGLALYGALGALIAIPVTAALVVIVNEVLLPWLRGREEAVPGETGGRRRDRAA